MLFKNYNMWTHDRDTQTEKCECYVDKWRQSSTVDVCLSSFRTYSSTDIQKKNDYCKQAGIFVKIGTPLTRSLVYLLVEFFSLKEN